MKTIAALILPLVLSINLSAEVTYTTETPKLSEKGRLQITIGRRDDAVVHRILRIDRNNKGIFSEYVEQFYIEGKVVLMLSEINDDYMIDCQNLGSSVVSLYYKKGHDKPEKMLVGKDEGTSEMYIETDDGTHISVLDEGRKAFLKTLAPLKVREKANKPNKALVPTPMSVTPAANAPVAPATGAAHL
jgi:hypothetical protein